MTCKIQENLNDTQAATPSGRLQYRIDPMNVASLKKEQVQRARLGLNQYSEWQLVWAFQNRSTQKLADLLQIGKACGH